MFPCQHKRNKKGTIIFFDLHIVFIYNVFMQIITPKQFYDQWAKNYEQDIRAMDWSAHDHILRAVENKIISGSRIFEAGIGSGTLAHKFTSTHDNVYVSGTDVSADMIQALTTNPGNHNIEAQELDLELSRLPFPDKSFDIGVSCGVFEYIEDISLVCSEMARILKRNGLVAIAYENDPDDPPDRTRTLAASNQRGIDDNGNVIEGTYFYYHHASGQLEDSFRQAGFATVSHYNFISTVVDGQPVCYNLFAAVKDGPDF